MSDEAHMEAYYRQRDLTRREPWHGLRPDEEAMAHEEGPTEDERRADVHEALFTYLFAGGGGDWKAVALRALGVIRRWSPALLAGRSVPPEIITAVADYYRPGSTEYTRFHLADLARLVQHDDHVVSRLIDFFFPDGPDWLKDGCRRLYIVARAYQPDLIKVEGRKDISFEDLARIFGELDDATPTAGHRARARWSARAAVVLRRPIESAGGKVPSLFGKSSTVREKYREAAMGNQHRKRSV